jgi:radical SAM superfamily enzyme YgiQ (UPF0313 family)
VIQGKYNTFNHQYLNNQTPLFKSNRRNLMTTNNKYPGKLALESGLPGRHPKGTGARVLLTSAFGPYAQDDEFGSRSINPMELYHNQVTRVQGVFSPRRFHHSWGIRFIQENISAPCTVLDFPTRESFTREVRTNRYDIVGISAIAVNVWKVKEMCRIVRENSPQAVIVVGGHVAAIPGLKEMIDADHIAMGEGIAWMRAYLGEEVAAPLRHPVLSTGFDFRIMGVKVPDRFVSASTIIASAGCMMGCNFCSTSAFFGGKGNVVNFLKTGEEIYRVMEAAEASNHVQGFSIMDENFLLQKKRALELMELMQKGRKSWTLSIFSSANAIRQYSIDELIELGVTVIWLGLESPRATYAKLEGADTKKLCRELQEHGITVLGSTIIGLEHHTPENIMEDIEYAVAHETDFHQFMLYTPVPGTPFYREMAEQGRLLDVDLADTHGQFAFNFEHEAITREKSTMYLLQAFKRDFERNGPSLFRMCRTTLNGWKRYKEHPDRRIRKIFGRKSNLLRYVFNPVLGVMERYNQNSNLAMAGRINSLRNELEQEFGPVTAASARLFSPLLLWTSRREEKRLARGVTYEPKPIVFRRNWKHLSPSPKLIPVRT